MLNDLAKDMKALDGKKPPFPPETKIKVQMLQRIIILFLNHCLGGMQGNVPKFEKLWQIRFQSNHFGWNNNAVNFCYFASKK